MVKLHKISFLFVAAVLFFGFFKTAEASVFDHESDFEVVKTDQESTIFPISNPELVGIQRQGISVVHILRIPQAQNTKKISNEDSNSGLLIETSLIPAESIYLSFSKEIDPSLTIRELLFPFHHFL